MNSSFFLFLPGRGDESTDLNSVELSWVYESENSELKLAQGLLSDAAVASAQYHITVVLPGEDVLFLKAEIPGKNIQHVRQAVPYALEDSVIEDVDELYFAISKSTDNQYNVAVINKHYLESVIQQLENADIYADAMVADYLLLAEKNTLFSIGKRVLFNGESLRFAASTETVIEAEINLADDLAENETIKFIYCDKETDKNNR